MPRMTDIKMLRDVAGWPWGIACPVKSVETNPEGWPKEFGLVLADNLKRVYLIGLYDVVSKTDWTKIPVKDYSSTEDLVKEWRVD